MFYSRVNVQVIKLAVANIESQGLSSNDVLLESVSWLRENYERTSEKQYLIKAVWHIYAYLELGYPYEIGRKEFERVLQYLEIDEEIFSLAKKWTSKTSSLSRANIKKILGRWNPKLHSMKIDEVVEEIINKVQSNDKGEYCYYSGKKISEQKDECLWERTFKLYVEDGKAILHYVNENKYYMFAQEK